MTLRGQVLYFKPAHRPIHPRYTTIDVSVVVGAPCVDCGETIGPDDDGFRYANGPVAHYECFQRQGGLNHLLRRCACYGGSSPERPDGMTRRAENRLACYLREHPDELRALLRGDQTGPVW